MITTRSYRGNNRISITSEIEKIFLLKRAVWIDCVNPSKEEIDAIFRKTGINPDDIKDCLDQSEKPRLQRDQKYFFFIVGVPVRKDGGQISTSPLGIFKGERFLLTVHKFKINALDDFVKKEESLVPVFKQGEERVMYNLLLSIFKDFYTIIEGFEQDLEKIENRVIKASDKTLHDILNAKKILLYIRRALRDNQEVISALKESTLIKKRALLYDLSVEAVQQVDMVELSRERLTVALEIYFSSVSNRLNEIMKYFTVIASLILLPTLISGIYGMNFQILPLKDHFYGFWIMIGIMLFSMTIMFLFFKKKKWV